MQSLQQSASAARAARVDAPESAPNIDQRVILHRIPWKVFEVMLAARSDQAGVRMYYLKGELELVSPSRSHESIKKILARLLEAYADELGLEMNGYGSWTLRSAERERGAEPDECYVLGMTSKETPDLAIEVAWTRGGLDKLEIYRGLSVREVWIWERTTGIEIHVLRGEQYERIARSEVLPEIDLALLASFLDRPSQSQAVRELRAALRAR